MTSRNLDNGISLRTYVHKQFPILTNQISLTSGEMAVGVLNCYRDHNTISFLYLCSKQLKENVSVFLCCRRKYVFVFLSSKLSVSSKQIDALLLLFTFNRCFLRKKRHLVDACADFNLFTHKK